MPLYINQKSNSRNVKLDCDVWDVDAILAEINNKILPEKLVLSGFEKIDNLGKFIDSNSEIAKHNNGKKWYRIYYDRLVKLNEVLANNK